MSRFFIFMMLVIFPVGLSAKTINPSVYLQGGEGVKLVDYEPGDRASSKEGFGPAGKAKLIQTFSKEKGKVFLCWGLTDGIKCSGLTGNADSRCQAALRRDRCDAVGEVLAPIGVTVIHAAGGKGLEIDGAHRGVVLKKFEVGKDGDKIPYCSQEELQSAKKIYREEDRKELRKVDVVVVPERRSMDEVERTVVVYTTYPAFLNRDNSLVDAPNKVCKALVKSGEVKTSSTREVVKDPPPVVKDPPKDETPPVVKDPPKGDEPSKGNDQVGDKDPPVVKDPPKDKTPPVVKDPEPSKPLPLFLRRAMIFGGFYYAKECASLSKSEASNFAAEGIFPLVLEDNFALRIALGLRSHSWNFQRDNGQVVTKQHDLFLYGGVEGMFRFTAGEIGLRVGVMGDNNLETYRPQAEAIARLFVYKKSLSLDARIGMGLFKFVSEFETDESKTKPYGYWLVGLTWHF